MNVGGYMNTTFRGFVTDRSFVCIYMQWKLTHLQNNSISVLNLAKTNHIYIATMTLEFTGEKENEAFALPHNLQFYPHFNEAVYNPYAESIIKIRQLTSDQHWNSRIQEAVTTLDYALSEASQRQCTQTGVAAWVFLAFCWMNRLWSCLQSVWPQCGLFVSTWCEVSGLIFGHIVGPVPSSITHTLNTLYLSGVTCDWFVQ